MTIKYTRTREGLISWWPVGGKRFINNIGGRDLLTNQKACCYWKRYCVLLFNFTQWSTNNAKNEYKYLTVLYFRRPVWPILIYKRCIWQKIHRFPKKIRQRSQIVNLNIKNRASRVNFPWSTIKCRHLLKIDRTYKFYKLKIQQERWKQTISCVIEMVLAKTRERNNVH